MKANLYPLVIITNCYSNSKVELNNRLGRSRNVCFGLKENGRDAGIIFLTHTNITDSLISPPMWVFTPATFATTDKVANFTWYYTLLQSVDLLRISAPTYIFSKAVFGNHIGHFAYRTISTGVYLDYFKKQGVALQNIFFLREQLPFLPWFTEIGSILGLFSFPGKIILPNQLTIGRGLCFNETYFAGSNEYYESRSQANEIRRRLHAYFGIQELACPPRRILVVRRENETRDYWNLNTVRRVVEQFGYPVDYFHFNSNLTAREQALKISQYGLIISPHGSQLSNLIFAQPRIAVIELTPLQWGVEFYRLGRANSMHYQIVEQGYSVSPYFTYEEFKEAYGKIKKGVDPGKIQKYIKFGKYVIDPVALEKAINNSLGYLKNMTEACNNWL